MESLSPQVVSVAKLPILNPNEFDLWKMRIEQYFLMTEYSLWEVILNGDSPTTTRVVDSVLQPVSPTTAEQDAKTLMEAIEKRFGGNTETKKKLISQLEILGVPLLQEDINLKFLRSLPFEWRTHTLIWRNKTDLEEHSLDELFNSLKIYEAEVKSSSSASTSTQNIAFVSSSNTNSTNKPVSVAASVSVVSAKMPVSSLPNVNSLSNAVIYSFFASQSSSPQLDNNDLKQIDTDDLEEMDLKWQMGSYDWSFQAEDDPTNYALMAFSSLTSSSNNELRDNALVSLRQTLEKAEQKRDDLKLKLEKFQTSSKNLTELLASQTNAKIGLGYDSQVFTRAMIDCDDSLSSGSDESLPLVLFMIAPIIKDWVSDSKDESETKTPQNVPCFVQSTEQVKYPRPSVQHVKTSISAATPKPTSPNPTSNGKRRNRKACFVCKSLDHLIKDCDYHEKKMAQPTARNHAHMGNHKQYAPMTHQNPQRHVVPAAVLTQSKLVPIHVVPINVVRPVSPVVPKLKVTRPTQYKPIVTKPNLPTRSHITHRPSPKASNSPPRVTAVQALVVNVAQGMQGKWEWRPKCLILDHGNPQHALKDKGVIDSRCSRHMIENMSYLSDFEELNGGYVAFGGNPKGGKIYGKGKIRT
nr:hypothetical protein [Tanacetum cinerariifolium]GEX75579.1 hypothetical protein [Tanacetum cinerariifolium]